MLIFNSVKTSPNFLKSVILWIYKYLYKAQI